MLKSSGLTRQLEDMVTLDRPGNRPAIELPAEPVPYTRSPKRVLIVEDNLDSVHTLVWLVRDMGHSVEYAINGYVGVDLARKNRPDIVLLDLGLPGLDGFEVCSRLKHEARHGALARDRHHWLCERRASRQVTRGGVRNASGEASGR